MGPTFGTCVRTLRQAQSLTQERLAELGGLSVEAIRRIERDALSPSLTTIGKVARGLRISLETLFQFYELGGRDLGLEIADLLATRSPQEVQRAMRILQSLFPAVP